MIGGADENQISTDLYLLEIGMEIHIFEIWVFRANEVVQAHGIGHSP